MHEERISQMFQVSQTAIEQAIRDIRSGVTYPDFWTNRYGEEDQDQQAVTPEQLEAAKPEEKAKKA